MDAALDRRTRRCLMAFAPLAVATSGFGQTFFVSLFGDGIRATFALSHTAYGSLYSAATLTSAVMLLWAGRWVDRWPLARMAGITVAGLALGCLVLAWAPGAGWLVLGFFLIRFCGQGLIAHTGITAAGRYFTRQRGRIMALTVAGFPLAEGVLPAVAAPLLAAQGWRAPWWAGAGVLVLLVGPVLVGLARAAPHPRDVARADAASTSPARGFTRAQAVRDPGLYALLPASLAVPFTVTAMLFHQGAVAAERGWTLAQMSNAFTGFAAGHLAALFVAGGLVDRLGAQRALAVALMPLVAGLGVLALSAAPWTPYLYLGLVGLSLGGTSTAGGALWPERYGVRHLGAIRALAHAVMVVSTAAAPLLFGAGLDAGLGAGTLAAGMAAAIGAAALAAALAPRTPRVAAATTD